MQLTGQQEAARDAALKWWSSGDERPLLIRGYAGTGKSTTIETIAREVTNDAPAYMAFTNKACRVLASKITRKLYCGTIHSAIYFITWHEAYEGALQKYEDLLIAIDLETDSIKLADLITKRDAMRANKEVWSSWELQDGFAWDRHFEDGAPAYDSDGGLIVVDECSMVRHDVGRDLCAVAAKAGYRIIAVGDPGQLPPVVGRDYTGPLDDVSWFTPARCAATEVLTEVMRQGADSNILKAATIARQGSTRLPWKTGAYPNLAILDRAYSKVDPTAYDQVICGRHVTRRAINADARQRLSRSSPEPQPGDKLMLQSNNKDDGYVNGDIMIVQSFDNRVMVGKLEHNDNSVKFKVKRQVTDYDDEKGPFSYGYAITCHKSQGSEYDKVLLLNEAYCFREDASKWLYTGVTRAKEFLTVLQ